MWRGNDGVPRPTSLPEVERPQGSGTLGTEPKVPWEASGHKSGLPRGSQSGTGDQIARPAPEIAVDEL